MSVLSVANLHFNSTGSERIELVSGNVNINTAGNFLVNGVRVSGGFSFVQIISTNTTAVRNTLYVATANLTLTLPASPGVSDTLAISNQSGFGNINVNRNSANIMGLAQDMTVDTIGTGFTLVYTGISKGWVII